VAGSPCGCGVDLRQVRLARCGGFSMAVRALVEVPPVTAMFDLTVNGAESSDTEGEGEG